MSDFITEVTYLIASSIETKEKILKDNHLLQDIVDVATTLGNALVNGKKILLAGNGGSASDSLHIAGEIIGRFQKERKPFPAVALNSDVATITAIANDYGYDNLFARQVEGLIKEGDVFLGISTSGNSENILRAVKVAKELGGITIGFSGKDGGKLAKAVEYAIVVPSMVTARIQECHIMIGHILCQLIEDYYFTV